MVFDHPNYLVDVHGRWRVSTRIQLRENHAKQECAFVGWLLLAHISYSFVAF
jgi:hypothetical protein